MDYELNTISSLEIVDKLSESAHVLIEEAGAIKRVHGSVISNINTGTGSGSNTSGEYDNGPTLEPYYVAIMNSKWVDLMDQGDGKLSTTINDTSIPSIKENTTYMVRWSRDEYICTPYEHNGHYSLGNAYIVDDSCEDTGEPFFVYVLEGTGVVVYGNDPNNTSQEVQILQEMSIEVYSKAHVEAETILYPLLEDTEVELYEEYGEMRYTIPANAPMFSVGTELVVRFNGVDYPCIYKRGLSEADWSTAYVGNPAVVWPDYEPDTGEPFFLTIFEGHGYVAHGNVNTFTIGLYYPYNGIHLEGFDSHVYMGAESDRGLMFGGLSCYDNGSDTLMWGISRVSIKDGCAQYDSKDFRNMK